MPIVIVRKIVRPRLDQGDFRHTVDMRIQGMHMKIAKARGKVALRAWVEILMFKEQDVTFGERNPEAFDNALGQRLCQVDARH